MKVNAHGKKTGDYEFIGVAIIVLSKITFILQLDKSKGFMLISFDCGNKIVVNEEDGKKVIQELNC